jgi:hypothetical protein
MRSALALASVGIGASASAIIPPRLPPRGDAAYSFTLEAAGKASGTSAPMLIASSSSMHLWLNFTDLASRLQAPLDSSRMVRTGSAESFLSATTPSSTAPMAASSSTRMGVAASSRRRLRSSNVTRVLEVSSSLPRTGRALLTMPFRHTRFRRVLRQATPLQRLTRVLGLPCRRPWRLEPVHQAQLLPEEVHHHHIEGPQRLRDAPANMQTIEYTCSRAGSQGQALSGWDMRREQRFLLPRLLSGLLLQLIRLLRFLACALRSRLPERLWYVFPRHKMRRGPSRLWRSVADLVPRQVTASRTQLATSPHPRPLRYAVTSTMSARQHPLRQRRSRHRLRQPLAITTSACRCLLHRLHASVSQRLLHRLRASASQRLRQLYA